MNNTAHSHSGNMATGNAACNSLAPFADQAIKLANLHQTPLLPKTYETWYSYAAGDNKKLKKRVDSIIDAGKIISSYDIDQIHHEHLSGLASKQSQQNKISLSLEKEMEDIADLLHFHFASSEKHSGSLKEATESLLEETRPDQIRKTIELLIQENKTVLKQTNSLAHKLEKSKKQINKMQSDLAESRKKEMLDPLTEIGNRRSFDAQIASEIVSSEENKSPLCLVLTDIDHFKKVNDTFGHPIGDKVLKYFCKLLSKNLKGGDMAARYGGEEFAIILPSTTLEDAKHLIEKIRVQFAETNLVITGTKRQIGAVTSSFGIAQLQQGDDPKSLFQRADDMLYKAKNSGRNRTECAG